MNLPESRDARGVVTLILNRPQRRNALDPALIANLTEALSRIDADPETRVVVLTGAEENFCAGGDIEWMRQASSLSAEENERDAAALGLMFKTLDQLSKPTVALVQGAAFGGGVGLVACCDIAIAANSAKFCLSEVRLGLIPAVVGPYVIRAIGPRHARALMLSAEIVGADWGLQIGLVHEVAAADGLTASRDRVIEALLLGAPGAQTQAKRLVEMCRERAHDPSLINETFRLLAERRASEEAAERLSGFLAKRRTKAQVSEGL